MQRTGLVDISRSYRCRRGCESVGEYFGDAAGHFVDRFGDDAVMLMVVLVLVIVLVLVVLHLRVVVRVSVTVAVTVAVRMSGYKQKAWKLEICFIFFPCSF